MLKVTIDQVVKLRFFGLLDNRQPIVKNVSQVLFSVCNPGDDSGTLTATSWSFVLQPAPRLCHLFGPLTVRLASRCVSGDSEVQHEALTLPTNSRRTFKHLVIRSLDSDDTILLIFQGITYYFSANFGRRHRIVFAVQWKKKLYMYSVCRSQWPRGLRRRSGAARLLRSWVRVWYKETSKEQWVNLLNL